MTARFVVLMLALLLGSGCLQSPEEADPSAAATTVVAFEPHVVVATLDNGANIFHPTWRRDQWAHPSTFIPDYPALTTAVDLTFGPTLIDSVNASLDSLALLGDGQLHWVPGTNLIGLWANASDAAPVFDVEAVRRGAPTAHSHGGHASSQIAGLGFSLASDAWLVVMDRQPDGGSVFGSTLATNAAGLRWAADQDWIDIIHTNVQNPVPLVHGQGLLTPVALESYPEALAYAVSKGKLVVSAGGNFWAEPTETSPHAGPPGVLAAGANDNCDTGQGGYTDFSNPDPHVVMDGGGTVSADDDSFDNDTFGGTSSASPRTAGYVAAVLLEVRRHFNDTAGFTDGALLVLDKSMAPASGPLADGRLTAAELHEVVRKTADPNPHASEYDGGQNYACIPQPADSPAAVYAKMGYGEVSEHTLWNAVNVTVGLSPMPERPIEDLFYERSEQLRHDIWD